MSFVKEPAAVASVPALLYYADSIQACSQQGTMLFYHGFGGNKERPEAYAVGLAQAGYLAISLDAVGHGDRRDPHFADVFNDERWAKEPEATEAAYRKWARKPLGVSQGMHGPLPLPVSPPHARRLL